MTPPLTSLEQRVLGSLIEKDMTTPDYYPLSVNALMMACNQKTNREPTTDYDEETVRQGISDLEERQLVDGRFDSRVPKYGHRASFAMNLNNRELALVCVLLLRGPQTLNELRDRTQRMYAFDDLDAVENSLRKLSERTPAMTVFLGRMAGQREPRWMHLLGGLVEATPVNTYTPPATAHAAAPPVANVANVTDVETRLAALETEVSLLRRRLSDLESRSQFV